MLQTMLSELDLSQAKLAKMMGVHPNTVGQWVKEGAPVSVMKYLEVRLAMKRLMGE